MALSIFDNLEEANDELEKIEDEIEIPHITKEEILKNYDFNFDVDVETLEFLKEQTIKVHKKGNTFYTELGKILKEDTKILINNIQNIENGKYENTSIINRPDELGEISYAMRNMSGSIKDGINEIESLSDEIINTQKEIIYTMGEIAETRSKETGNHVKRVAEYSKLLALKLGLDEKTADMLKLASPMHDIGKVGIPDNILNKPGKHTFEEFEIMKTHAQLGYEMLKHSSKPILQAAAIVSREHHEKYNGKGYPKGLSGENIHIFARITAVADVFDALGSDRVYKKAWEDDKIFELFNNERAEHFDPKIVDIFFENIEEIKQIREQFKDV